MRVGDSRPIAHSIAGGTRIGARALGSNSQQAALVNSCDGTTAGADRVYIEHRHAHRKPVDGRLHRFSRRAIHQTDIGGRTAHVETQNAWESGEARCFHRSNDSPSRSGKDGTNRVAAGFPGGHESAVRLHDGNGMARASLQFTEILGH